MGYRVIIPVYNEEKYIKKFLDRFDSDLLKKTIFVNDGSIDRTNKILHDYQEIEIVTHEKNLGKGQAMKTGALKAER